MLFSCYWMIFYKFFNEQFYVTYFVNTHFVHYDSFTNRLYAFHTNTILPPIRNILSVPWSHGSVGRAHRSHRWGKEFDDRRWRESHRILSQRIGSELPCGQSRPYPLRTLVRVQLSPLPPVKKQEGIFMPSRRFRLILSHSVDNLFPHCSGYDFCISCILFLLLSWRPRGSPSQHRSAVFPPLM